MEHCKFSKKVNDPHYFPYAIHHHGYDKATYGWNLLDYVIAPFPIRNKCNNYLINIKLKCYFWT
jgi:hypothetical protein